MRWTIAYASALGLAACAAPPPAPPQTGSRAAALAADYCARAQRQSGTVYRLDPAHSAVRIFAFRAGAAAAAGHDHVLTAPTFVGYAQIPAAGFSGARFDLEVALADLVVDPPPLRSATGGAFATPLGAQDVEATRRHMLGDRNLQAERFPYVEIHSAAVAGEPPVAAARVAFTLHGVTREQDVALRVARTARGFSARGSLVIRQSDFGIAPYAVLGGLLAVADPVVVEFELAGAPLSGCQP